MHARFISPEKLSAILYIFALIYIIFRIFGKSFVMIMAYKAFHSVWTIDCIKRRGITFFNVIWSIEGTAKLIFALHLHNFFVSTFQSNVFTSFHMWHSNKVLGKGMKMQPSKVWPCIMQPYNTMIKHQRWKQRYQSKVVKVKFRGKWKYAS